MFMAKNYQSNRIATFTETVFATYSRLAKELDAVNLGQGFPDFAPPDFVLEALKDSVNANQQYAPLSGIPKLLRAAAKKASSNLGRKIDPNTEALILVGATEALFASIQAFVDPGDEVIIFEPFYDAYPADTIMAGGIAKYVPLHPQANGQWVFDLAELKAAFSNKTKLIILNTPHNPTGKVFTAKELDVIVDLAETYDALILSDEVYEHIAFESHLCVASREGAFERTITISSVGKTFSVTGWKIGWLIAPAPLVKAVSTAHQWIPFVVATPLQIATAQVLTEAEGSSYYQEVSKMYEAKRDLLVGALKQTPFKPLSPQGSYFVMADSSELDYKDDVELCLDLPKRIGVVAIPPSAFYSEEHKHLAKNLVRFAFCKTDEVLLEAAKRLKEL